MHSDKKPQSNSSQRRWVIYSIRDKHGTQVGPARGGYITQTQEEEIHKNMKLQIQKMPNHSVTISSTPNAPINLASNPLAKWRFVPKKSINNLGKNKRSPQR